MGVSVQYRKLTNSQGALLLSLFFLLSIVSMIAIAIFALCVEERSQVMQEVAREAANELAVGGAWYAVHALDANSSDVQISYPTALSEGESIQYDKSPTPAGVIVTVTAIVHQPVISKRRVVFLYSLTLKRLVSWTEV